MFELTAGRIQLDINSLLVNIYTDRYVGNEGIYIVFARRMHIILVLSDFLCVYCRFCLSVEIRSYAVVGCSCWCSMLEQWVPRWSSRPSWAQNTSTLWKTCATRYTYKYIIYSATKVWILLLDLIRLMPKGINFLGSYCLFLSLYLSLSNFSNTTF